jgi:hypothetical protein
MRSSPSDFPRMHEVFTSRPVPGWGRTNAEILDTLIAELEDPRASKEIAENVARDAFMVDARNYSTPKHWTGTEADKEAFRQWLDALGRAFVADYKALLARSEATRTPPRR